MLDLEDITYSRTDTTAAINDYYHFLTLTYMNDSQVIYPPAEGWPSIINADPEILQSLGKSDEVLELLAHLPYIRSSSSEHEAQGGAVCIFADWQDLFSLLAGPTGRFNTEDLRVFTEDPVFSQFEAPHTFGLRGGGRENPVIVLDTMLGIIHWEECPDRIETQHYSESVDYTELFDDDSSDETDQEEVLWRQSATAWAIPDFFEVLKAQFRVLHWIPMSPYIVENTSTSLNTEKVSCPCYRISIAGMAGPTWLRIANPNVWRQ